MEQDDGPDEYDLPPTSAGISAAVATTTDSDGKTAVNGVPPEAERWKKTGWEPRFGSGETAEEKEDTRTLLDHQTFLEGKLDERLFGGKLKTTDLRFKTDPTNPLPLLNLA